MSLSNYQKQHLQNLLFNLYVEEALICGPSGYFLPTALIKLKNGSIFQELLSPSNKLKGHFTQAVGCQYFQKTVLMSWHVSPIQHQFTGTNKKKMFKLIFTPKNLSNYPISESFTQEIGHRSYILHFHVILRTNMLIH